MNYRTCAADQGHINAQYRLGKIYLQGTEYENKRIEQNNALALEYFTRAADQGHIDARYYLGSIYYEGGNEIEPNKGLGLRFLRLAADNGHGRAQYQLGKFLCLEGNPEYSHYFQLAKDQELPVTPFDNLLVVLEFFGKGRQ